MHETILVIDDSYEIAHVLNEYILTPLGYNTLWAENGQTGLKMAAKHQPDLIMLDMNMPRLNGLETLMALRENDDQTPVIFMTMHGSESMAVEVFRLGVRDYLTKPFTVEEVQRAIDRALKETRLVRQKEELSHTLIVSETVRQTVVALSHYINNHLMIVSGGLSLLKEDLTDDALPTEHPHLMRILQDSQDSASKIEAVLRVLQRVTKVKQANYSGHITMIDIEAALKEELIES